MIAQTVAAFNGWDWVEVGFLFVFFTIFAGLAQRSHVKSKHRQRAIQRVRDLPEGKTR